MNSSEWRLGALALGVLLLAGCGLEARDTEVDYDVPVTIREVETGTVEDLIRATGTLRVPKVVQLTVETTGLLSLGRRDDGRPLAEGDRVSKGQLIAEVTGEDVRLAARLEANQQRFRSAERDYQSKKRLFEEGLIAEQEFIQAESALADARQELDSSRFTQDRARLTTPISGVILRLARNADGQPLADGQRVANGFVVAEIAPTSELICDVDLVGTDAARVERGMLARVRHHAFEDEVFEGRLVRLAPSHDPTTRTFRVEVEVDNAAGRLRPGMFLEVVFVAETREDVPIVPRQAVVERQGRKVVFVVSGKKAQRRDVLLGLGDDRRVEIREGVEPGERIVTRGVETLSDETPVRDSGA